MTTNWSRSVENVMGAAQIVPPVSTDQRGVPVRESSAKKVVWSPPNTMPPRVERSPPILTPESIVAQSRLAPILPCPCSSRRIQGTDRRVKRSAADCRWRTRREEDHALLQDRNKHQVQRRIKTGRPPTRGTNV